VTSITCVVQIKINVEYKKDLFVLNGNFSESYRPVYIITGIIMRGSEEIFLLETMYRKILQLQ